MGRLTAQAVLCGAMLVLLANDLWWKGSGVLPAWLTGKLSDFAGLIVAPAALALLFGQRSRLVGLGVVVTALVFALINLSGTCSSTCIALLSMIGVSWTLWPDPTDLLALSVLPLSWVLAHNLSLSAERTRLLSIPAALACLASGGTPPAWSAPVFIYNATGRAITVDIASVPGLDCKDIDRHGLDIIVQSDFSSAGLFSVGSHEVIPIDASGTGATTTAGAVLGAACNCGLYRVSVAGSSLFFRVDPGNVRLPRIPENDQLRRNRDRILVVKSGPKLDPGSSLTVVDPPLEPKLGSCEEPPQLSFSVPLSLNQAQLLSVQPVAGNCFELWLTPGEPPVSIDGVGGAPNAGGAASLGGAGMAGAAHAGAPNAGGTASDLPDDLERAIVCAPIEMFPFQVGDRLNLTVDQSNTATHSLDLTSPDATRRFRVLQGASPQLFAPSGEGDCGVMRSADGRLWTQVLQPGQGQVIESSITTGQYSVYRGRGRQYLIGTCNDATPWLEVAESWSP